MQMSGRLDCAFSAEPFFDGVSGLEDSSGGCRKAVLHGAIGRVATGKLAAVERVDLVEGVDLVDGVVVIGFAALFLSAQICVHLRLVFNGGDD
jgi:hypothetical protein